MHLYLWHYYGMYNGAQNFPTPGRFTSFRRHDGCTTKCRAYACQMSDFSCHVRKRLIKVKQKSSNTTDSNVAGLVDNNWRRQDFIYKGQ